MYANFPPEFLAFLNENHIDPSVYDVQEGLPRYVRIVRYKQRTTSEIQQLVEQTRQDAGCAVTEVAGVAGFLEIANQSVKLAQLQSYKCGDVVGMDVSSGIAVHALSVSPGDNVLDLCCAPGAKLLLLAEQCMDTTTPGSVTGVDNSSHRISTCRSLIKKHAGKTRGIIRLFSADGTGFSCHAPRKLWWDPQTVRAFAQQNTTAVAAADLSATKEQVWFAPRLLSTVYACSGTELYDRVLVDAECTHDGSLVHIRKYGEQWGWELLGSQACGSDRTQHVPVLQSRLLENGWRLLKPGGVLVYSTCSLSRFQNELVLGGFLARHTEDEACVESIPLFDDKDGGCGIAVLPVWKPETEEEWMQHAARLDPRVSNTSGMFIARIRK
ncbi:S-adenosyl-L-methionine-dependent methyltransferase, partial [Coemansia reversa NRRL 1564]